MILQKTEHLLNDIWSYYFHDPYDTNWNVESYHRLGNITCIEEFWPIHTNLKPKLHQGMFFLMREHVFPCWDDPFNKDGGCLSIKVLKDDLPDVWETLNIKLLGEIVVKNLDKRESFWDHVNGLSTSPKRHFCIIKIWLKSAQVTLEDLDLESTLTKHSEILFKLNSETISTN